jgi:hypothetical protein
MSSSIRDILGRFLARIGANVGVRWAVDAKGARSLAEHPCDCRTIDRRIENLGSASHPERAVDVLVALGEPALLRLLDVFDNKVSVPRGRSDRRASIGRNQALVRLAKRYPDRVLDYCQTRNYLNPSLNLVLSMSGDERLEGLAAQATKQFGWINLPEFESTTSQAPPSEPDAAVDRAEIDRWIEQLGSGGEWAIDKVVSFGEPALRRLLELHYGDASLPIRCHVIDAADGRFNALARFTRRHPDLALELVRGRPTMPIPVIAAFRTWGDERLKMIADIASKNNMRVPGLTS